MNISDKTTIQDYKVREVALTAPRIRSDLRFTYQKYNGKDYYIIEDPVHNHFYRVGVREYKLISLLDGKTPVSQAMAILANSEYSIDEEEIPQILHWLMETQLIQTKTSIRTQRLQVVAQKAQKNWQQRTSELLFLKIPLVNPDKILHKISPGVRFLWGKYFAVIWLGLVLCGLYIGFSNLPRFVASTNGLLEASNWLWLYLAWVLLKALHEMAHGMVCKHYGGVVPEIGIMLMLFSPLGYAETSSSWRFSSKWQRIHVAIAGMFVEIFVASIATIIWANSSPGVSQNFAYNIVIMAGISTLLFNANPLMRFDGYYVLIDYLEYPNLYSHSKNYISYLAKKYLLGVNTSFPGSPKKRALLGLYGILAFFWRIVLSCSLIITACNLFLGLGIVLALLAIVLWFLLPLAKFIHYLFWHDAPDRPNLRHSAVCFTAIFVLVYSVGTLLSYREKYYAPVVIQYDERQTVRAVCPGFLTTIHVKTGDFVATGTAIATLQNLELQGEIVQLEKDISALQILIQQLQQQNEIALAQGQMKYLASLQKIYSEKQQYYSSLVLVSKTPGIVLTTHIDNLEGRYFSSGDAVIEIANPQSKYLEIAIDHKDIEIFREYQNSLLDIRVHNHKRSLQGTLSYISPRAQYEIPESLSSIAGGPLAVQQSQQHYRLYSPRFIGHIKLKDDILQHHYVGEIGWARLTTPQQSLGSYVVNKCKIWWESQLQQSNLQFLLW